MKLGAAVQPLEGMKASEMYLRKISPSATCLYSLGSRLPRSLSAA